MTRAAVIAEDPWRCSQDKRYRTLYVRWTISLLCNYRCHYCFFAGHQRKQVIRKKRRSPIREVFFGDRALYGHAFDNYPARRWIRKFKVLAQGRKLALGITGGEPFLDRRNFSLTLRELSAMEEIDNIRIDTNGTFSPGSYKGINLEKIFLNISFHSEFINLSEFYDKVKKIQAAGFNVMMVNYVMSPGQRDLFPQVREKFGELGIKVNPAVFIDKEGSVIAKDDLAFYQPYLSGFDIANKCNNRELKGKIRCHYPQVGLDLTPDGLLYNTCFTAIKSDFFTASRKDMDALLEEKMTLCPAEECTCLQMYSFQEGCERNQSSLNTLKNYVDNALLPDYVE